MRITLWVFVALVSGCVFVNDPASHMGGAPPIPSNELCRRILELQCRGYFECCPTAPDDRTIEECVTPMLAECTAGLGALLADERTGYDPEEAGRVVAEAESFIEDDCSLAMAEWASSRDGVFRIFGGTIASGGTCTPRSRDDVGALLSCDDPDDGCTAGVGATRFVCADRASSGPCFTQYECAHGFACIPQSDLPASSECVPQAPTGAECRENGDCASSVCARAPADPMGTCIVPTREAVYCGPS